MTMVRERDGSSVKVLDADGQGVTPAPPGQFAHKRVDRSGLAVTSNRDADVHYGLLLRRSAEALLDSAARLRDSQKTLLRLIEILELYNSEASPSGQTRPLIAAVPPPTHAPTALD